jgi:hypothetical protein
MRFVYSIITFVTILSCGNEKPKGLEYIFLRRNGMMDTISRELLYNKHNDTFNIISYRTTWDKDVDQQEYKFAVKSEYDSLTNFVLLDSTIIEFENKEYKVFKYLFDDKRGDDEEMFYFYSPDFGIISFRSAAWGNYDRLTKTGDVKNDRITFYLMEMIINDDNFFIQ